MSNERPILPMPQDMRWQMNTELGDRELSSLDDNARFVVRRMVGEAYTKGFHHGWTAGQLDASTDNSIRFDAQSKAAKS